MVGKLRPQVRDVNQPPEHTDWVAAEKITRP
jgi:hypothetical protein